MKPTDQELRRWAVTQRSFYHGGRLNTASARKLEALPGWTWDQQGKFAPFSKARKFARTLNLRGSKAYKRWAKSEDRPLNIPTHPYIVYRGQWRGWPDFLGYKPVFKTPSQYVVICRKLVEERGYVPRNTWCLKNNLGGLWSCIKKYPSLFSEFPLQRIHLMAGFLPFKKARSFARRLEINTVAKWIAFARSHARPQNIPSNPYQYYGKDWKGWDDFLGAPSPYKSVSDWVAIARQLVQQNSGILPRRLSRTYPGLYDCMSRYPASFKQFKRAK